MNVLLQTLGDRSGFKLRSAAVIVRDGRLLLHRATDQDVWYLPGGTGEFGEWSRHTLIRELREELYVDADVGRLLYVVEHFFETRARRWHQIASLFETALPEGCDAVRRETWEDEQPDGRVVFRWVPLDELRTLRIAPGFLAAALHDLPREPRHVVHTESFV